MAKENNMATRITLFIGADNKTRTITEEYEKKIESILSKYWDNFTLTRHKGCYKGKVEDSISAVIIVLQLVFRDLDACITDLKVILVQESVGCEIVANVDFKLR